MLATFSIHRQQWQVAALSSLLWSVVQTQSVHHPPTATTLNGTYAGRFNVHYNEDEFLGMPYAQAPIRSNRFKAPVSLNTTWSGTRDANEYSPIVSRR
jgi:hypothetical protein